jgi:hypothetical protein
MYRPGDRLGSNRLSVIAIHLTRILTYRNKEKIEYRTKDAVVQKSLMKQGTTDLCCTRTPKPAGAKVAQVTARQNVPL